MKKRFLLASSIIAVASLSLLAIVTLIKLNEAIEMEDQNYIKE